MFNNYQLMIKARNIIRNPARWTKGTFKKKNWDGSFAVCAIGACQEVSNQYSPLGHRFGMENRLTHYLRRALPDGATSVVDFNDTRSRKHKEIVAWFQRAVRLAAKASKLDVTC